jgi:hypothetical protein
MTFRQSTSAVGLCNRALSMLAQTAISSIDPPSPPGAASREAALWYKPTVARLLETHHWGLALRSAELAAVANDRSDWLYALAAPDDMAFPAGFTQYGGAAGVSYYKGLGGLLASRLGRPMFMLKGRTLYSNWSSTLDYVSFDITEADFTETFANIVVLSLAAVLAMPITKNAKRERELRDQATTAMNIAITQSLNEGNHRYGDEMSDRDFARGTGLPTPWAGSASWDWWPGSI